MNLGDDREAREYEERIFVDEKAFSMWPWWCSLVGVYVLVDTCFLYQHSDCMRVFSAKFVTVLYHFVCFINVPVCAY